MGLAIFAEREVKVLSAATHSLCIPFLTKGSSEPGAWRAGPRGQLWGGQWPCLPCAGEGRCKEGVFRLEPAGGRLGDEGEVLHGGSWPRPGKCLKAGGSELCEQRAEGALLEAGQPFRPLPPTSSTSSLIPLACPSGLLCPPAGLGGGFSGCGFCLLRGGAPRYVLSTEGAGRGPEGP